MHPRTAAEAQFPAFFSGRLQRHFVRAPDADLRSFVQAVGCFEAVFKLFPSFEPQTVLRMYHLDRPKFRKLVTPHFCELAGPGCSKDDMYLFINFLRADLEHFAELELFSLKGASPSILSVLSNKKKSLMPEDLDFLKFVCNLVAFNHNYGRDHRPDIANESRTSVVELRSRGCSNLQEKLSRWDVITPKFFPLQTQVPANPVSLTQLFSAKELRSHLYYSRSRGLLSFSLEASTLSMVRNAKVIGKFQISNYFTNFDLCYCRRSGVLGLMTQELVNEGVRVFKLRLFATNNALRLVRTVVLDTFLGVLNVMAVASPTDSFMVDFMKIRDPETQLSSSVVLLAWKSLLVLLAVGATERVMRYEGEREWVSAVTPLGENYLLVAYENFALHHLSFTGFSQQTVLRKLWLPDAVVAMKSLDRFRVNLVFRFLKQSAELSVADSSLTYIDSKREGGSVEKHHVYWHAQGSKWLVVGKYEVWIETVVGC